jgi:uncharacterized protein YdaU (DUF1376 family)
MRRVNIWYPIYAADFAIDTAHLTPEQVGAYVRILNTMWRQSGQLKNDDNYLAKVVGVSLKKWLKIKVVIEPLFNTTDATCWSCDWLFAELEKAISNSEAKSKNAQKRWQKSNQKTMQVHSGCNANASDESMQMQCPSPSPSPSPKPPYVKGSRGSNRVENLDPHALTLAEAVAQGLVR